jgi:hypothetical protein
MGENDAEVKRLRKEAVELRAEAGRLLLEALERDEQVRELLMGEGQQLE